MRAKLLLFALSAVLSLCASVGADPPRGGPWPAEQAQAWQTREGWRIGCTYRSEEVELIRTISAGKRKATP